MPATTRSQTNKLNAFTEQYNKATPETQTKFKVYLAKNYNSDGTEKKTGSKQSGTTVANSKTKQKREPSKFILFCKEHRDKVKQENPDASFGAIGKILGTMYEALSDEEKAAYASPNVEGIKPETKAYLAKYAAEYNEGKITLIPSAFSLFHREVRLDVGKEHVKNSIGENNRIVKQMYDALPDEVRQSYIDAVAHAFVKRVEPIAKPTIVGIKPETKAYLATQVSGFRARTIYSIPTSYQLFKREVRLIVGKLNPQNTIGENDRLTRQMFDDLPANVRQTYIDATIEARKEALAKSSIDMPENKAEIKPEINPEDKYNFISPYFLLAGLPTSSTLDEVKARYIELSALKNIPEQSRRLLEFAYQMILEEKGDSSQKEKGVSIQKGPIVLTPYEVLGLPPSASMDEVKKAYHALAVKFHPAFNHGKEEMFRKVSTAYETIQKAHDESAHNLAQDVFKGFFKSETKPDKKADDFFNEFFKAGPEAKITQLSSSNHKYVPFSHKEAVPECKQS